MSDTSDIGARLADRRNMEIVYRSPAELIGYEKNARTHSEEQLGMIMESMRTFGWTTPLLIDEFNKIIAGHGRLECAKRLRLKSDIPCIVLTGLTEAQKQALVIADNAIAAKAGWDHDLLVSEISEILDNGFSLGTIGFNDQDLAALLGGTAPGEGLTDPDEVPSAPVDPVSVLGDVWQLGSHRLVCGDCTDENAVKLALNGVKPLLMVTDPPYGVKYDPNWRSGLDAVKRSTGKVENDDVADWRDAYALFPGDVVYVWHAPQFASVVQQGLEDCGFGLRAQIIWAKPHFVLGRGDYHPQHEPCLYMVKKSAKGHWSGDRKQSTIWQIANGTFQGGKAAKEDEKTGHGTQKPVECMKRPIENNSSPGQAVYEPFSGSGTTIIAGEMTGRGVHAIELNPAYVDVAVKRWQNYTGKAAVLASTGKTYAEMASERASAS